MNSFKTFKPFQKFKSSDECQNGEHKTSLLANSTYAPPWWLPGGHLQTIYAYARAANHIIHYRRERWETPDGDFIDLDWLDAAHSEAKLLVLFHGLEGSSRSHYALSVMELAQREGWRGVVPNFRGCSGEVNRLPRSYHSGDAQEIDWVLRRLKEQNPGCKIYVAGVSIGGNMLLNWLGERGSAAGAIVERAVAISAPVDLNAAARVLDVGLRKMIYTRSFLNSIKPKLLAKISARRLELDPAAVLSCSTFREMDDLYTAPIHGFKDAFDYWTRASSKPWLKRICVPTLLINALNDPFLPLDALPQPSEVSAAVTLNFSPAGGHVGFVTGSSPTNHAWLCKRLREFYHLG